MNHPLPTRSTGRRLAPLVLMLLAGAACAAPRALVPAESRIEFVVKEMGVPVHGVFKRFESTIDIDLARLPQSSALLKIDVGSLSTGTDEADAIAVDKDWLDKARAPFAVFRTTAIRALAPGRFEARGQLSLRNVSRDFTIQFTSADQAGGRTLIASEFVIRRADFGIGAGEWNEPGIVAEEIPVKVLLMLAAAPAAR
jgi:polyisoprenoid-binding protein YceI